MKKYDLGQIKRFNAPYLEQGFKEEEFELKEFFYDVQNNESIAQFEVVKHYTTANEPDFYLDSLAAIKLMYKLVVINICLEKGVKADRDFPLFSRNTSIECRKFINQKNIGIKMTLTRKKTLKEGTYYCYSADFCDGAFLGEVKLMVHPYSFYEQQ